jgi:hypothetical protein
MLLYSLQEKKEGNLYTFVIINIDKTTENPCTI